MTLRGAMFSAMEKGRGQEARQRCPAPWTTTLEKEAHMKSHSGQINDSARARNENASGTKLACARKPITKGLRFKVLSRDGFTCQYCGGHPPHVTLHVDHVVPVKAGGGNDLSNLITSCHFCNLGKAASVDVVVPSWADLVDDSQAENAAIALQMKEEIQKLRLEIDHENELARQAEHRFTMLGFELDSLRQLLGLS